MAKGYDAIVVGGGPVGCLTAREIAKQGFRVALLEEHAEIGVPVHCGGLVSLRALRFLPQAMREEPVLSRIYGARIHPPSLDPFEVSSSSPRGVVIDRARFDLCFSMSAMDAGVEIMTSTRFLGAGRSKGGFVVRSSRATELRSRVVIGADGVSSQVARTCRFPRTEEVIPSCGIYAKDSDRDCSHVDVYVGSKVAPGFFAWVIPSSESVNIGLGTRYGVSPQGYLKRFLKKIVMDRGSPWKTYYASGIPVGPRAKTAKGGVALVGDAAGHAKPMSGGGIYTGLRCASILAKVTCDALEKSVVPDLELYDVAWRRALGKELRRGMWLRKVYLNMNDRHMDEICRLFGSDDILSVITEKGDLDYPSRLVLPLLRRAPGLAKFAGPLLKSLI